MSARISIDRTERKALDQAKVWLRRGRVAVAVEILADAARVIATRKDVTT